MADWTGVTTRGVADIAAAACAGAPTEFNAVQRKINKFGWRANPEGDDGVFGQFESEPA